MDHLVEIFKFDSDKNKTNSLFKMFGSFAECEKFLLKVGSVPKHLNLEVHDSIMNNHVPEELKMLDEKCYKIIFVEKFPEDKENLKGAVVKKIK